MQKHSTSYIVTHIVIGVILLFIVYFIAFGNFRECRQMGFSRTYCTFTHLIR